MHFSTSDEIVEAIPFPPARTGFYLAVRSAKGRSWQAAMSQANLWLGIRTVVPVSKSLFSAYTLF